MKENLPMRAALASLLVLALVPAASSFADDAPTQVVVLVSGRTGVDKSAGENVAEAVSAALGANGFGIAASPQAAATKLQLEGVSDTATCSARPDCVALMAKGFAPAIVVGLSIGKVGKKIACQLAAVQSGKSAVLTQSAFVLSRANLEDPDVHEPVAKFSKALHDWVKKHPEAFVVETPPAPQPPPPEPKVETPPPPPPEPQVAVVNNPPPPVETAKPAPQEGPAWAKYTGIALGVLAVGAAGFGAYDGAGAMSDGNALKQNPNATLTGWQAAGNRAQIADIAYGGAVILAAAAVVLVIVGFKSSGAKPSDSGSGPGMTWDFR